MPFFSTLRPRFLEPLEEIPLVVPFPDAHILSSGPGALGLFNETPSTIDMSLPTPSIPVFAMFSGELPPPAQVLYETPVPQSEAIQPPPAPLIKDMDSFSEGTAQGSFDFTMCSDHAEAPPPLSVAFSPDHPTLSIEIWRDDVVRSTTVGWEEGHPRNDEDANIFEEPATKRRRLSLFSPATEEERPATAPMNRRSQSLPPVSLLLIRNGDDCDSSVAPLPAAVSSPCSAPPTLA
ncbi:hypothetical protein F5148DRAFT_812471 [Russula earlei]|uniref:Uncharacterized protein n=1 Tax=Russula earlei TaxID=71964 RepID=A0ACC0UBZ6_9AGAM|nr:hypothetical protein F5148DRAFT_812471 [Russula earlei]